MTGWNSRPIPVDDARGWVAKARPLAAGLLELAGPVADPAPVAAAAVPAAADGMYGNFMLAWLDPQPGTRLVRHLRDGAFFVRLLRRTYAPVLERRPELARALDDVSRFEVSLTNDTLQLQLETLTEGYSMVRHHALMLFAATLWLDEPGRTLWLDLYDALVDELQASGRWPDLADLARTEAVAFTDLERFAADSVDAGRADALFDDDATLADVVDYQLYAAVAIGLLWRDYRDVPEPERAAWWADSLGRGYVDPRFLEQTWMEHR